MQQELKLKGNMVTWHLELFTMYVGYFMCAL